MMAKVWKPVEPKRTIHTWDVSGKECMDTIQISKAFEYLDGPRQLMSVAEQFGVCEASVYLPDHIRLCELVNADVPTVAMTPERVTMLRSLLALAEVEEPSYGRGEIHAEILAAIEEAKAVLSELAGEG